MITENFKNKVDDKFFEKIKLCPKCGEKMKKILSDDYFKPKYYCPKRYEHEL